MASYEAIEMGAAVICRQIEDSLKYKKGCIMQLLEEMYAEVILNERLKTIKITPDIIQMELQNQYRQYMQREKAMGHNVSTAKFQPEKGDIEVVKKMIALFP